MKNANKEVVKNPEDSSVPNEWYVFDINGKDLYLQKSLAEDAHFDVAGFIELQKRKRQAK